MEELEPDIQLVRKSDIHVQSFRKQQLLEWTLRIFSVSTVNVVEVSRERGGYVGRKSRMGPGRHSMF